MNDENYESFLTYDSRHKIKKGGKGVGRLTWLKVFKNIHLYSIYESERGAHSVRTFDFLLNNSEPIQNFEVHKMAALAPNLKTSVKLNSLKHGYDTSCPKKVETIKNRVVAHFLSFLLGDVCPDIYVSHKGEDYILWDDIKDHSHRSEVEKFVVEDEAAGITGLGTFTIKHVMLSKALVESKEHRIFLAAHARIVSDHAINNQTGLESAFSIETSDGEEDQVMYVGIVSGDFLDVNVTQERNNFDVSERALKLIRKIATDRAKAYLHEPIERIIAAKAQTINQVIDRFPRYGYLVKDRKKFAAEKLKLNSKTEEDIYKEMSVYDYRNTREVAGELKSLVEAGLSPTDDTQFDAAIKRLMEKIGEQEKASPAEYVGKRKLVIDLLETRLGYEDIEKKRKYTEEAVHQVICPLKVNSGDITYGQHNLWLLDDRLAYYDYWASDQNIRKYVKSSDCASRPDLILFQGSNLLRRESTNQPVVIVEFKRPARQEYTDDENPVKQVYDYVRELRDNKITDSSGQLITDIGQNTPFFCYLVCDITPKLLSNLEYYNISQELPGGRGYFGFNNKLGAYVEVLQYAQIVKDAKLRHEAFFNRLGIS